MTADYIGAEHEFHSKEFACGWAERFTPTPERLRLFDLIYSQLLETVPGSGGIIELGIGPAYLAQYLLDRMPNISYVGIDFSSPMLEIAKERLGDFSSRVTYIQADLVGDPWETGLDIPVNAVVSTWALHDLASPRNIKTAYERSYRALQDGGILLNGDFVKPIGATQEFEGGRFYVTEHIKILNNIGFSNPTCLAYFEEEIEEPTPAQNYACMHAKK